MHAYRSVFAVRCHTAQRKMRALGLEVNDPEMSMFALNRDDGLRNRRSFDIAALRWQSHRGNNAKNSKCDDEFNKIKSKMIEFGQLIVITLGNSYQHFSAFNPVAVRLPV